MQLPTTIDPSDFDARYRRAFDEWGPAVHEVCARHGLACSDVRPFRDGSNLVAEVDGRLVVKLFPPFHRHQWESERRALPCFTGRLPVRVPELAAEGERSDGYTYVVLERVNGRPLDEVWVEVPHAERVELLRSIGEVMASAHSVPLGEAATLEPRWGDFLSAQIEGCRARHARLGAPAWVVEGIDAFVRPSLAALDLGPPHVLLTGEYTPFNLLVDGDAHAPRLAAMIDFGDALIGPPAYDLLGPVTFLCAGDPALREALFRGRGLVPWPGGPAQSRGLLALLLTHRYAHLDAQLRLAGWREAGSLDALAERVFG